MTLRSIAVGLGLIFAITLAIVVGKQMSAEAIAVVVGVVCGVAAGHPTSVLLLVVFGRRDRIRMADMNRQTRQHSYPPVVVVQGGVPQALPPGPQAGYWPSPPPGSTDDRQFNVVGGDDLVVEDGRYETF